MIAGLLYRLPERLRQLGGRERLPRHLRDGLGVHQVIRPDHGAELPQVHLGNDDPLETGEQVAQVAGQRVEVAQVNLGQAMARGLEAATRPGDGPPRLAPAHHRHGCLGVAMNLSGGYVVGDESDPLGP